MEQQHGIKQREGYYSLTYALGAVSASLKGSYQLVIPNWVQGDSRLAYV